MSAVEICCYSSIALMQSIVSSCIVTPFSTSTAERAAGVRSAYSESTVCWWSGWGHLPRKDPLCFLPALPRPLQDLSIRNTPLFDAAGSEVNCLKELLSVLPKLSQLTSLQLSNCTKSAAPAAATAYSALSASTTLPTCTCGRSPSRPGHGRRCFQSRAPCAN